MSRTAKLRAVEAPIAPVDAIAAAEDALLLAVTELDAARAAEAEALRRYDEDDSLADAAGVAQRARERCERRHAAALASLKQAVGAAGQEQVQRDHREMETSIAFVSNLAALLAPHLIELRALDRQARPIVDKIASVVVDGQDAFERATALGERLEQVHIVQRSISNPSMRWAALLARVLIARDRIHQASDLANGWLSSEVEPHQTSPARGAYEAAVSVVEQIERTK